MDLALPTDGPCGISNTNPCRIVCCTAKQDFEASEFLEKCNGLSIIPELVDIECVKPAEDACLSALKAAGCEGQCEIHWFEENNCF